MKAVLTGPGALGQAVLTELARVGVRGRALSRRAAPALPLGWDAIRADLTDPSSLRGTCEGCATVIHLAAVTHSNKHGEYHRVNVEGTRHLLAEARAARVEHFVYVSTRAIDPRGGAYSRSKAEAEDLVRAAGLPWTILRPAEVYGAGREGLSRVLEKVRAGDRIPVVGDGRWRLAPVFLDDLVVAIRTSVLRSPTARTYHLVGPEEIEFRQLVDRLSRFFGTRPRPVYIPAWLLSAVARLLAAARVRNPPLYRDQVARLLAPKPFALEPAASELDFRPRPLESGLVAVYGSPGRIAPNLGVVR